MGVCLHTVQDDHRGLGEVPPTVCTGMLLPNMAPKSVSIMDKLVSVMSVLGCS